MSIMKANLKHLYQRRCMWVIYAFFGIILAASVSIPAEHPKAGEGRFVSLIGCGGLIGLFAATILLDVLLKPFSFTLPGHRSVVRKFLFGACFLYNIPACLIFFLYPEMDFVGHLLISISAFGIGLIMFWFGVWIVFAGRNTAVVLGFLPLIVMLSALWGLTSLVEKMVVTMPIGCFTAGGVVTIIAWILLGNDRLLKKYASRTKLLFFDAWNREKARQYLAETREEKKWPVTMPAAEKFFLKKIRSNMHRTGQYTWGSFYGTWGHTFSSRINIFWMIVSFILMLVFLCYFPNSPQMLYLIPVMILCQFQLPVFSSLTIYGGRRQRYVSSLFMVVILSVCVLAWIWSLAGLSHLIAPHMPVLAFDGSEFKFAPMTFGLWYVPLITIPVLFIMQLKFSRNQVAMMTSVMVVFLFMMLGGILQQNYLKQFDMYVIPSALVIVGIAWWLFILMLRKKCFTQKIGPA